MKVNPNKFQFTISPNSAVTTLRSKKKSVKALWVITDKRLTFNDHISACCLKVARQLNALARISKSWSKSIIYNSFIRSNFDYCPLVWHFCEKINNNQLEKIQERSLRILQDSYELAYEKLLNRNGSGTLLLHRLKLLILETYKSFHGMNANCLHNIFKFNCTSHERRSVKLIQSKRRTTSYGLRPFSYLRSQLWNDIVNSDPGMATCDFNDLMDFLKHWEGPNMNEGFPYVWHFTTLNALSFYRIFALSYFELFLRSSITFM